MRSLFILVVIILFPVLANSQSTEALQTFESAVAASRKGRHIDALSRFRRTLDIIEREAAPDSFSSTVHYNIAVSLYQLCILDEAAVHLKYSLRYSKNLNGRAFYLLGLIGLERKDPAVARDALQKAVALDNRNGDAWYHLGRAYLSLKEIEKAERSFKKAARYGAETQALPESNARATSLNIYE